MTSEKNLLSPKQMGAAYKLSVAVHFMIREIDNLQETSMYRHKLKLTAKAFLKELETHSAETIWSEGGDGDMNTVYDQMETLSNHFGNLLITAIAADRLKPGEQTMFWQDMQMSFKRHKMPLRIHNGVLELTSV